MSFQSKCQQKIILKMVEGGLRESE